MACAKVPAIAPELAPFSYSDSRFRVMLLLVPALGIGAMILSGHLRWRETIDASGTMWRPVVAITSMMVLTAGAGRLGLLNRVAAGLFPLAQGSTVRLFTATFVLSAGTAAILNNDSAILLLTPLVVPMVRRLYPDHPDLIYPFVFAIFMAAGVAPLVVSNPMNLIFAEYVGMNFNAYLVRMMPIAIAGWVVSFVFLRLAFARTLRSGSPVLEVKADSSPWSRKEMSGLVLVLGVLTAYPIVTYLGGPIWAVAAVGALGTLLICAGYSVGSPAGIAKRDISWDILVFLSLLSIFAVGVQNAGFSVWLAEIYERGGNVMIGVVSALGSALINNHPMSLLNISALDPGPTSDLKPILAALIGGDLGPRLLPAGSLAGLLWLATLRRLVVHVPLAEFCKVGALLTVPSLAVSLMVLSFLG